MLEESSVGGIPCWEESRVIKVNAKAKKYESLGGILLESVTKKKKKIVKFAHAHFNFSSIGTPRKNNVALLSHSSKKKFSLEWDVHSANGTAPKSVIWVTHN